MATEIVRWCDVCMSGDERVSGAAHAVQLDARSGTVDLCPEHTKSLLGPLLDVLAPTTARTTPTAARGRKPEPGPAECLLCDQYMRAERMSSHLGKAHGTTVAEVYGITCPVCDRELTSANGVGSHARAHGADGLVGLWVQVAQLGDPDGKLAALRARVSDSDHTSRNAT